MTELESETTRAVTFDHLVRKIPAAELEAALSQAGLPVVRRYATRIANDLLAANDRKFDENYFDELLALELALCDQEPYVRIGGMYQLICAKT
jgi:S-adenosylmethionine-dependent methyltransferase